MSEATAETCPAWPGIQFLGDLTVAPEGPRIAAELAAGGVRAEVPLAGMATGPSGTGEYTILPAEPGAAWFTPLHTDTRPHDTIGVLECTATLYISHPARGCVGITEGVYTILRSHTGTCGFCGTRLTRMCGQWWSSGTWTGDPRDAACPAPEAPFERHAPKPDVLQDIPAPPRGSGKIDCCGSHRQRCLRGGHQWATWISYDGVLQRTPGTLYFRPCGGVCTAGETGIHDDARKARE
jgi:hypothetical protein